MVKMASRVTSVNIDITNSNHCFAVVLAILTLAAVVSVSVDATTILCPSNCRCLERGSVVHCSDVVHVPAVPASVVVLNLDHNRISLLQNSSLRGAVVSSSGSGRAVGLRRLEVLSVEDNGLLYVEPGALAALYELRVLRLGRNHLSTLPRDLLINNRKLQVLDVHANYLATIPDDVVRHVHALVSINISFNHLTSARLGDGFRHTGQLSTVDMSGNNIATLESDAFSVMQWWDDSIQRHINLSHCNVRNLQPGALHGVPRLATLSLDGSPRLPQDQLEAALAGIRHQPALDVVRLSHGNVTDAAAVVRQLQSATNLTALDLSHNRIRSVGKRAFFFLSALRRLRLGHNDIASVDGLAGGLARLEYLDLSFNCLERLDAAAFEGMHELRVLDVSHNSLTGEFDAEPLIGLFNLHTIDVTRNRIRSFRIDDGGLESLETMDAAWNRVDDLSFVRRLPRLKTLDLSYNAVERVGDDIFASRAGSGLAATTIRLNLSGNAISEVSSSAFRHSTFDVVDLSFNRLKTLVNYGWSSSSSAASSGSVIGGVRLLAINDNYIVNISGDAFAGLGLSLVELRAERNSIYRLPVTSSFGLLHRLRTLDVSSNPIGKFVESLTPKSSSDRGDLFGHLEVLRLNDVGLMSWPAVLLGISGLTNLDLAGNRIRSVPDDALSGMRRLRRVDLSRNRLSAFDPPRVGLPSASTTEPVTVDLSDNPLDCTCSLETLCRHLFPGTPDAAAVGTDVIDSPDADSDRNYHRPQRRHHRRTSAVNNTRTFRCRTPNEWNNVPLEEFCADMVQCSRFGTVVAAGVSGIIAVVVVLLLAVFGCRKFRRSRRRTDGDTLKPNTNIGGGGGSVKGPGIYIATSDGGTGKSRRCRLDSYEFVVDETTLTSGSNTSSGSSNTTTTSGGGGGGTATGPAAPLVKHEQFPVPNLAQLSSSQSNVGHCSNLHANLVMTKPWL